MALETRQVISHYPKASGHFVRDSWCPKGKGIIYAWLKVFQFKWFVKSPPNETHLLDEINPRITS